MRTDGDEFAQCGLKPLIKVAQDLGIEWHLVADGDKSGKDYENTALGFLGADTRADKITSMSEPDIEHCFWHAGYQATYEQAVDGAHRAMVKAAPGAVAYPTETIEAAIKSTSKPHLAYAVLAEAATRGPQGVPASLKIAIQTAMTLAGKSS